MKRNDLVKKTVAAMSALVIVGGGIYTEYIPSSVFENRTVSAAKSAELDISQNGIDFICAREGFSATCYADGTQSSIGYGTKCTGASGVHQSGLHSITKEAAKSEMMSQINSRYAPNVRKQTAGLDMSQSQFDALVSLCYNTGGGTSIISNSPLVKYIRGELSESDARSQYSAYYVYSNGKLMQGLVTRRNAEANLFFSDVPVTVTTSAPDGAYYPACASWYTSVSEALGSVGEDGSYARRCEIAAANGVEGYQGTYEQNVYLLDLLKSGRLKKTGGIVVTESTSNVYDAYYPACASWYTSVSEALGSVGEDGSYARRCEIAAANGVEGYHGAYEQNVYLLDLLKSGRLKKANVNVTVTEAVVTQPVTSVTETMVSETTVHTATTEMSTTVSVTETVTTAAESSALTTSETTTVLAKELILEEYSIVMHEGEQYQIKANQDKLSYKSSDSDTALVSANGIITAFRSGSVQIYVISENNDVKIIKLSIEAEEKDIIYGDINDDMTVDMTDLSVLSLYLLGDGEIIETQRKAADANGDGEIDIVDLAHLRQYICRNISWIGVR